MSTLFSKRVQDELKRAEAIAEASRSYADVFASKRAAHFKELGLKAAPSEEALGVAFRVRGVALEARMALVQRATAKVAEEVGDDAAVFAARDASVDEVHSILREFRALATPACGDAAMTELGFQGETTREPAPLVTFGTHVLAKVNEAPPKSTKKSVKFDAQLALEGLDDALVSLKKNNAAVLREGRELVLARSQRDEAFALFDRELKSAAAALDADLRAVGLDDVADRLLPSRSRTAASAEEPAPAPTPDAPKPTT